MCYTEITFLRRRKEKKLNHFEDFEDVVAHQITLINVKFITHHTCQFNMGAPGTCPQFVIDGLEPSNLMLKFFTSTDLSTLI